MEKSYEAVHFGQWLDRNESCTIDFMLLVLSSIATITYNIIVSKQVIVHVGVSQICQQNIFLDGKNDESLFSMNVASVVSYSNTILKSSVLCPNTRTRRQKGQEEAQKIHCYHSKLTRL